MNTSPKYRVFEYTLSPGQREEIHRIGDSLTCLEANAAFEVSFDNNPVTEFVQGLTFAAPGGFEMVTLRNPNATAVTVKVGIATGDVRDARLVISAPVSSNILGGSSMINSGAVLLPYVRTKIADANAGRMTINVSNMGTGPIFIGNATVNAWEGQPLNAGKAVALSVTSEVFAFNDNTGSIPVAILEVHR